ncbi:MAG: methyltransferase domain-containing protein [Vicingaceae bacterium]|nr:methyltransferase domain-containing protein [Vicingaceae bacterium]
MNSIKHIENIDIYLLDQFLKGRLKPEDRILDAGCGSGRNIKLLINEGYTVFGIDEKIEAIDQLKAIHPDLQHNFTPSSIEKYDSPQKFDYIICNAVLHFAKNHDHFDNQFNKLISLLNQKGTLFIRMTTDIGIKDLLLQSNNGVYNLPDKTSRYLITNDKINSLLLKYSLELIEPIKTVVVDVKRSMATLVFKKK